MHRFSKYSDGQDYKWQGRVGSLRDTEMPLILKRYFEGEIGAPEAIEALNAKRYIGYRHIPDEKVQLKEGMNDLCRFYTSKIEMAERLKKGKRQGN
ncbi:MAG: hypothetical protein ABH919_00985 [bacterium]